MEKPATIVFDIQTQAYPLEAIEEPQRSYLMKSATTDDERAEAMAKINLIPFTARLLAVGMVNPYTFRGRVFYQHPGGKASQADGGRVELIPGSERDILSSFWDVITHYPRFITFNGRGFGCPYLMLRSALLGIPASRNLLPYRFSPSEHCDLLDQLSFYGAFRRFTLDFYCQSFGIRVPNVEGNWEVGTAYSPEEDGYRSIAGNCLGDARATAELFLRWEAYLSTTAHSH